MDDSMRPEIERAVAEYLFVDARQRAGMTVDKLASVVWPDQSVESSRMKIDRFLKPQRTGQPKNMYLFDFLRFCEALDIDPIRALTEILLTAQKTREEKK